MVIRYTCSAARAQSYSKRYFFFLDRISHLKVNNEVVASLDVKSPFTNIPVNFTLDIILHSIFNKEVKKSYGLLRLQLKKLFQWTSRGIIFQFNGQLYEQIDGVAMGSPIASLIADVSMNWVLDQIPYNTPKPQLITRYVDDIFCIFSNRTELNNYFESISKIHKSISFSKEVESNNQLA